MQLRYIQQWVCLVLFMSLGTFSLSAFASPLGETREIIYSGEGIVLKQKANKLKSPAALYEYVRNTHEYALYHGSRSNTINTFLGQRGSDVDIASVLIALYRSQNTPARYAVATVSAPAVDVANWLSVKNVNLAAAIMDDQGIQNVNLIQDGVTQVIKFEHVWVQVQVPYDNYRGAFASTVNCTATPNQCQWINVDPSWKLRQFHNQGIDVYGTVNFDYTRYYNAIKNDDDAYRDKSPLEIYEEQILAWLKINYPGKTLDDVADPGKIIAINNGILPASLPFKVHGNIDTYNSIETHDAAKNPDWAKFLTIQYSLGAFSFTGGLVGPFLLSSSADPIALADLSTQRITLSYFEGNQISGDLFEHHQMSIRLGGKIIDTPILISWQNDQADYLGRLFSITFKLDGAPSTTGGDNNIINATYNNLMFGGYYVIGTGGDTSNWSQVHRAAGQLLDANKIFPIVNDGNAVPYVDSNSNGIIDNGEARLLDDPLAQDELTGGLLNVAMTQYYTRFVENTRRLDSINHILSPIEGFVGIVSSTYDVDYLGETSFSIMPGGLLIDMKGVQFNGSWRNNAASDFANDHFELLGHEGSSLEHEIWQELTGFDAVSTVRGIQMALASGASLLDLDDGSVDTVNSMYSELGFTESAPPAFAINARDLFGTRPTTWSHAETTNNKGFDLLKKYLDSSTELNAAKLVYTNDVWHTNVGCFDSQEQAIRDLITQHGGSVTLNASTICGYAYSDGTTLNQLLSGFENHFEDFFAVGSKGKYDYLDQLQGFAVNDFVFRNHQATADIHSSSLVQSIRDALIFGGAVGINPGRWEYRIPSRKTNTGFNIFSVFLKKIYDDTNNSLVSQSYSISNDSFTAGGGWVDGSQTLTLAESSGSVVKPSFNNEVFTDKNLVAQTNNDLIRTPSTSDPVSTVTGNMYHDETDLTIKGRGIAFALTRSYNSGPGRLNKDGPFGYGWTHSYNMELRSNDYGKCPNCKASQAVENGNNKPSSLTYIDERGGEHTYILNSDSAGTRTVVENPPGEFERLQLNTPTAGQYTLSFRNGVKYVFEETDAPNMLTIPNNTARLKTIADPYNNRLNFAYDGSGRLISITDNLGISGRTGLAFTYQGTTQHIHTLSDWSGRVWTYLYEGNGNLGSMKNPLNQLTDYTYHAGSHLLNEIIKPQSRDGKKVKTAFAYYRNNKAFNYVNTLGETETLDYDLYRQRTRITDPRGFIREHFYDKDNGGLIKLKEPDGAILKFSNNVDGLRYSKTDGLGFDTQYSFRTDRSISLLASNTNGLVTREVDALNQKTDFNYGVFDQLTTTINKRGHSVTQNHYTTTNATSNAVAGKLNEVRATVNGKLNVLLEKYLYYATGIAFGQIKQRIEFIDPNNLARKRFTDYVYEANGINLKTQTIRGATSGGSVIQSFTYDALGRLKSNTLKRRTSAINAVLLNLTTTYQYDALGRITRVTTPQGDIQETVYDANGKVTQQKVHYLTTTARPNCAAPNAGYVVCTYSRNLYDAADRLIQSTDILGHRSTFSYDAMGNLIEQTDANGHTSKFEYDAMNRRTAAIDANEHRTEFVYDLAGRLIQTIDANGHRVTSEYDQLGRLNKVITEQGRESQMQYDANNNPTHVLDANAIANPSYPRNNQSVSLYSEYDELNRKTSELDALNGVTRYSYDLLGNIISLTDAENLVTRFVYDDLGRIIKTVDPVIEASADKTDRVLLYDQAGNVLLTEDRSGRQRRHSYDVMGRLTGTEYLADNSQDVYDYDAFGDLVTISNADVSYQYSYTPRHEMARKTDSRLNKSLNWHYDAVGNVESKTDYQSDVTEFQFDSTNRLVAMRNADYLQVSYHYDGAGRLIDRILSNGAKTRYGYDEDNRLMQLTNTSAKGTVVEKLSYQHDQVGNIIKITDSVRGTATHYSYDALYRLKNVNSNVNAEDRNYSYDKVGNRKTETQNGTTYVYCYHVSNCNAAPKGNRLINIRTGSATGPLYRQFDYDNNGRLLKKLDGAGTALYNVTYNGKGRAKTINGNSFAYDPNDYRIKKKNKLYLLEGEHLEATYSASGVLQNKYLRGVVVDEIVNGYTYHSSNANDWTNYTFHHDHLNSVTALTGHAGSTEEKTHYDAFGSALNLALPGTGNEQLFTGRQLDVDIGLYYYRARYYDPEIGRFITEDPLGFGAGVNFYAYVENNPINFNDPTGKYAVIDDAIFTVGGAIIGVAAQAGVDLIRGEVSSLQGYVAAGVGGAVTGESLLYLGPVAAGALGGAASNLTKQALYWADSQQQGININSLAFDTAVGAITGLILGAKIPGITSGRGNFNSIFKQITTKFSNGTISNVTTKTASKMFAGRATDTSLLPGAIAATGASFGYDALTANVDVPQNNFNDFGDPNLDFPNYASFGSDLGAAGGFVLYPSKPNTNTLRSVYSK